MDAKIDLCRAKIAREFTLRGSVGVVIQTPGVGEDWTDAKNWDAGLTGSVGVAAGLKGDAGVQVSLAPGKISENEGKSVSVNATVGPISGSYTKQCNGTKCFNSSGSPQGSGPVDVNGKEQISGKGNVKVLEKANLKIGKVGVGVSASLDKRGSITIQKVLDFFKKK